MCAQVKEKLEIIRVFEDLALQTGVVVCTRFPDMLTDANTCYKNKPAMMVGVQKFADALIRFRGMAAGTANYIDVSEGASGLNGVILTLLPAGFADDKCALLDLHLCYRNSLDRAAEEGQAIVTFIHPTIFFGVDEAVLARTAICSIGDWLLKSPYREKISSVRIACVDLNAEYLNKSIYDRVVTRAEPLDCHPTLRDLLDYDKKQGGGGEYSLELVEEELHEELMRTAQAVSTPVARNFEFTERDVIEWNRLLRNPQEIERRQDEIYEQLFLNNGQAMIQLTKFLFRRVLLVESREGRVYSFSYARTHANGKIVFDCDSCNLVSSRTGVSQRARAIVDDCGAMEFQTATHHPDCWPKTKFMVITEQLRRRARFYQAAAHQMDDEGEEDYEATLSTDPARYDEIITINSDDDEDDEGGADVIHRAGGSNCKALGPEARKS